MALNDKYKLTNNDSSNNLRDIWCRVQMLVHDGVMVCVHVRVCGVVCMCVLCVTRVGCGGVGVGVGVGMAWLYVCGCGLVLCGTARLSNVWVGVVHKTHPLKSYRQSRLSIIV